MLTCVLPGRSTAVERIVDRRDANTALFPAIRINLAWYSATFESQSTSDNEFIEFSHQSKILTLIFSCWLPPGWTSCLSSSEALRRDSASQYTDCSSCCLLKNDNQPCEKIFIWYYITTLFSFLSLFFSLHSRKLIKMMYHSLHSRASKNGREINVEEQMGRTRSTRHSGKKSWRSPNSTPPPTRILRNNHLAAAGAAAAAYLPPSAITHDLIFFSFISD